MSRLDALIEALLRWLADGIGPYLGPYRPGRFTVTLSEVFTPMGKSYLATVHFPALPTPNDIVKQELTMTVNGTAGAPSNPDLTATDLPIGTFAVGDQLSASLRYFDDAGNPSVPRVETLVIADTVPPPEPGEFGFHLDEVIS